MNRVGAFGIPSVGYIRGNGSGAGGSATVPNQALAAQPAWFVDGSNSTGLASNSNDGTTAATPLLTKGEFARRMFGVSLTQSITVTFLSDLLPTDNATPFIWGNVSAGFSVNYVGTPTSLRTGTITAKVDRNGATSTVTQITDSALPVSWTASGLIGRTIEVDTGGGVIIRAVVVADLGAKTAWISPPIISTTNLETTFTVGQTYNVWRLTDFASPQIFGGFNTFKYLTTQTRWMCLTGRNDFISCGGGFLAPVHGGTQGLINHTTFGSINLNFGVNFAGRAKLTGGYIALDLACAHVEINQSITLLTATVENNSVLTTAFLGTQPDVEFNTLAGLTAVVRMNISGGRVIFTGFVYGLSATANLVLFDAADSHVHFKVQPNVTGATNIVGSFAGVTELASRLTSIEYNDYFNNRVLGPAGPVLEIDRNQVALTARGALAETVPGNGQLNATILTAGNAYFVGLGLRAGDIVSNVSLSVTTGGTVMTVSLIGIYDKAGNRLAVSADQGASWQTVGLKTVPVAFVAPTTDIYYVGIFAAGATLPIIVRGQISTTIPQFALGANPAWGYVQVGVATLPSPAIFAVNATQLTAYWFLLS